MLLCPSCMSADGITVCTCLTHFRPLMAHVARQTAGEKRRQYSRSCHCGSADGFTRSAAAILIGFRRWSRIRRTFKCVFLPRRWAVGENTAPADTHRARRGLECFEASLAASWFLRGGTFLVDRPHSLCRETVTRLTACSDLHCRKSVTALAVSLPYMVPIWCPENTKARQSVCIGLDVLATAEWRHTARKTLGPASHSPMYVLVQLRRLSSARRTQTILGELFCPGRGARVTSLLGRGSHGVVKRAS